jgi:phage tail-like protein
MAKLPQDEHIFCNNFEVQFQNATVTDVISVTPITIGYPKIESTTGNYVAERQYIPGRPTYGDITFEGATHADGVKPVMDWVKDGYKGNLARKQITVILKNQDQQPARTYNLMETLPIDWKCIDLGSQAGPSVLKWRLTVRVQRIEMA